MPPENIRKRLEIEHCDIMSLYSTGFLLKKFDELTSKDTIMRIEV